jgi:hypothetical protein
MIRNMRIFAQVATASLAIAFTVGMFIASQLFIASRGSAESDRANPIADRTALNSKESNPPTPREFTLVDLHRIRSY